MHRNWTFRLCLPLASAAILVGCNSGQDRTAIDHDSQKPSENRQLTLSGCLGSGIGTNEYMVTGIQLAPLSVQPSDTLTTTENPQLTPNSEVRLAVNDHKELDKLMGQKVTVTGTLIDNGHNTIGTSGQGQTPANGQTESRNDRSQAATQQHYSGKVANEAGPIGQRSLNNGTFPEMTVAKIEGTGEKCQAWHGEEKR